MKRFDENRKQKIRWSEIHTIALDFDGVFTNNKVVVDQNGIESVTCDRSDGLAFDILRKFIELNNWNLDFFIVSTEINNVVSARSKKMKIKCYQGVKNKYNFIKKRLNERKDLFESDKKLVFIGNDLNDLNAMLFADFCVAPIDAHPQILKIADLVINKNGGDGFIRKFIEDLINLDEMSSLELKELLSYSLKE